MLTTLLAEHPAALAGERPSAAEWSVLEIACHLVDEEREDFRARLESTLADPDAAWAPIDPEGWVAARGYAKRDLTAVTKDFVRERARSVAWLRGLGDVDWERTHRRPGLGTLRAGDVLASWVAHDALHLKQLAKRMHQRCRADAAPFSTDYAGPWTP